ncbi:MAG TPA: CotH kinase family protein, partial [Verrucomicrobiales bacterium]|nr:CotH kinase family protein [Verrucomicrobiales bacterium]
MTRFLPSLLGFSLLISGALPAFAAPVITEFLAVNSTGIRDNEGNRQAWIEIFNPGTTTVNLGGYTLTNNAAQPTLYTIPSSYNVPAGSYTLIFASGLNRATLGNPLHTNFTLSAGGGGYLGLFAPGATTTAVSEYVGYPAQTANVSYGVISNFPGAARDFFHVPTPQAANNSDVQRAEKVDFSLSSRTFNQGGQLSLTLSTPSGGGSIRYTTDRTEPTSSSTLYTGPITINYSVRIRARNFVAGLPDSKVTSETYLELDPAAQTFTSNVPIMILHSWGSGHPSTAAPAQGQPEDSKLASWFVFEPKAPDNLARMTNLPDLATPAYFERRGSSTFGEVKYSMTMGALDEDYQGTDVSPLGFASNDDFVLNAPYTFDRSLVHNDLIYRLSNEVGRYAVRTQHCELFTSVANDVAASGNIPAYGRINGAPTGADYYGVYSFQDKISRGKNRVDVEKIGPEDNTAPAVQGGYLFKIDRLDTGDAGVAGGGRSVGLVYPKEFATYPAHLAVATAQQKAYLGGVLNTMYASCTSANFMNPATGYQAYLDVPAAIDHWILSVIPKSADAFRLSGYWSKSRTGKLVMGPIFDFDRGEGSTDGRDLNPNTWRGDNGDLGTDYFHNASIYSPNYFHYMFQDPNFWQALIDRYNEMRQGNLSTAHVMAVIDEYIAQLDPGDAASTPAKRNFQKFAPNG